MHPDRPGYPHHHLRTQYGRRRYPGRGTDSTRLCQHLTLVDSALIGNRPAVRFFYDDFLVLLRSSDLKGWTYLLGEGRNKELVFKAMFCAFVALGCTVQLGAVLEFSDAMVFVIALPNIIGLYLLAPTIKRELKNYQRLVSERDK